MDDFEVILLYSIYYYLMWRYRIKIIYYYTEEKKEKNGEIRKKKM